MTNPTPCGTCGQTHDRCTAHNRAGNPCGRRPSPYQTVCNLHGGRSPQALAAAERRANIARARAEVLARALPDDVDPHTALLDELRRTAGWVAYLEAKVDELDEDDLVWGTTRTKTGGDDHGITEEAKPHAWFVLLRDERRHLLDVAKACVSAGIEERRIQLAEGQGRLLAAAIDRILTALNLTPQQQQLVPRVVPEALRHVAATATQIEEETR